MTLIRRVFDFFIYSSIYIGLCCVIMCLLTYLYVGAESTYYLIFAFSGTLCSYNFHWYLTRAHDDPEGRVRWSIENRSLHILLFFVGLAGAAFAFFHLLQYWQWLAIAAILTFLYSAPMIPFSTFQWLKKIAVGKTAFLAFAWTHVTVNIPIVLAGNLWTTEHYLFAINRFFFIFSICILFDYRDRDIDFANGIRSMITQITETGVNVVFWTSNAIVLFTTIALLRDEYWIFMPVFLLPSVILSAGYRFFKRSDSDLVFYFILDGLMMVTGLLVVFGYLYVFKLN